MNPIRPLTEGEQEEFRLFTEAVKLLGKPPEQLTPWEVSQKMSELAAERWSEESIQQVLKLGARAIFTRLVMNYSPQKMRELDNELLALPGAPADTTWRSAVDGAPTGCLGFPERVRHVVLDYLKWRRDGLLNHQFCRCHSERN